MTNCHYHVIDNYEIKIKHLALLITNIEIFLFEAKTLIIFWLFVIDKIYQFLWLILVQMWRQYFKGPGLISVPCFDCEMERSYST
jgi:hypothetical protein